ncbi:MAG TPA: carboxypeptidase-like regulatory domain-containing protein, partial [Hymenobacter sp.]
TPTELLSLRRSLVVLDNTQLAAATLRQGPVLRPLVRGRLGNAIGGPFRPDSALLRDAYGLRRKFLFEPLFRYSFGKNLLKMECVDGGELGPLNGTGHYYSLPLKGFAYTEADFKREPQWAEAVTPDYLRAALDGPYATPAGQGRLELRRPKESGSADQQLPASCFVLLTRPDQPKFQRLERGTGLIHALAPGRYRVAVLLADSSCLAPAEDVLIQPNGQAYYELRLTDRLPAGRLSRRINQRLWAHYKHLIRTTLANPASARREIRVETPVVFPMGWRKVRGQVVDAASEEGIPGVTVLLKGTQLGVSTAADGSFTLQVPPDGSSILVFSSVGYASQEVLLGGQSIVLTTLHQDVKQLNEVVVTGLGIQRERRSLAYSVASVTSNFLQGRVAGVQVNVVAPGAGARIAIRGGAALSGNTQPLIILDGLPFNGLLTDLDPASIASIKTLAGAQATGLYGALAANGVLLISTKKSAGPDAANGDPRLALRRHFRDYAWWRPLLVTDARGLARTEVVLPDDVTSWDSFVLASDNHGRLGQATSRLRSFKQLRAELATPRFLVAGDRTQLLGKSLNYGFDTAHVTTTFRASGQVLRRQDRRVSPVALDTLTFTAPATGALDSVQLSFALAQANGYQDGEQRSLPVLPAGTRERV